MANSLTLMGLGMSPILANVIGENAVNIVPTAGTIATATQIPGSGFLIVATTCTSGGGILLPNLGGGNGTDLGDVFIVTNVGANTLTVFASNLLNAQTFTGTGASTAGTTGVSVSANYSRIFWQATTTTWASMYA